MLPSLDDPCSLLSALITVGREKEWLEFKHNNSDREVIGKNLSALSNSALLSDQPFGYVVWGVHNDTLDLVGTTFDPRATKHKDLELWLSLGLEPRVNLRIEPFTCKDVHFVILQVQAAPNRPVAFYGKKHIRGGRTYDTTFTFS
jgi:ATP-dependent DNA helicase RecG